MKHISKFGIVLVVGIWALLTCFAWLLPEKDTSLWERRPLQQMPTFSVDSLLNGGFMEKFEDYTLDQFPARDSFRTLKSLFSYKVLQLKDNNGIYIADGYAGKIEYPLKDVSVSYAMKKLNYIYDTYLKGTESKIYMTVIPDKSYYLAAGNGYPTMDYEKLFADVKAAAPWADYVDITDDLSLSDYYRTDTHWRQEKLENVAKTLCERMGLTLPELKPVLATQCFYGVYYGQAALPMAAEELYLMEGERLKNCRVYNYETKTYGNVYDTEKLSGADPYETYLSGAQALLTIENPNAATDRELIIFRDSFGSSLAPYLVQDYKTITLVDIRYISSQLLGEYLTFHGQDVLFAYSSLILNNSTTMK